MIFVNFAFFPGLAIFLVELMLLAVSIIQGEIIIPYPTSWYIKACTLIRYIDAWMHNYNLMYRNIYISLSIKFLIKFAIWIQKLNRNGTKAGICKICKFSFNRWKNANELQIILYGRV